MRNSVLWVSMASFLGVNLAFAFSADESAAMPAFARKYDSPCSSCHVAFPKLNEFGIEFKQRGYRMEDEGVGQPVWKLPGIPIGGIAEVEYAFSNNDPAPGDTRMRSSEAGAVGVEFFFGGVLAPKISFFGDFGADVTAGEALTPDLAFIIFDDVVSDSRLNLKFGNFDADVPYLSDARRPTVADYLVRISADGGEGVSLGKRGAEMNGYLKNTKTRYAVGVGNDAVVVGTDGEGEDNSLRAVHAWVTQSAELLGYNQTLGLFFSSDRNSVATFGDPTVIPTGDIDSTQAFGVTLDLHFGLTGVLVGGFRYKGSKIAELDAEVTSGLVEVFHSFSPNLVGVARVDYQEYTDDTPAGGADAMKLQYVGNVQYFFSPNVKAVAEVGFVNDEPAGGPEEGDERSGKLLAVIGF